MAAIAPTVAAITATLAKAAPVIQTIATIGSAGATVAGGVMANRARQQEAAQLKMKANEELSQAQMEAQQFARRKRLALSRIQAVSAASGFSADDPTTLDLMGETEAYGTLQEQLAMFGGKSRRAGYQAAASASRQAGTAGLIGSLASASGTIASGVSSMAARYADPAPRATARSGGLRSMAMEFDY